MQNDNGMAAMLDDKTKKALSSSIVFWMSKRDTYAKLANYSVGMFNVCCLSFLSPVSVKSGSR